MTLGQSPPSSSISEYSAGVEETGLLSDPETEDRKKQTPGRVAMSRSIELNRLEGL